MNLKRKPKLKDSQSIFQKIVALKVIPIIPEKKSVQDMVIEDIEERKKIGLENYGTLLYTDNGRSMLQDLYEELLDACCYLRGLLEEEKNED